MNIRRKGQVSNHKGFAQGIQGPGHLHTRMGSTVSRSEADTRLYRPGSDLLALEGHRRKTSFQIQVYKKCRPSAPAQQPPSVFHQ